MFCTKPLRVLGCKTHLKSEFVVPFLTKCNHVLIRDSLASFSRTTVCSFDTALLGAGYGSPLNCCMLASWNAVNFGRVASSLPGEAAASVAGVSVVGMYIAGWPGATYCLNPSGSSINTSVRVGVVLALTMPAHSFDMGEMVLVSTTHGGACSSWFDGVLLYTRK